MTPDAVLILSPSVDLPRLLSLTHKMLGYSLADAVDASRKQHSDDDKFLSCLAALRDQQAPAGLSQDVLSHTSYSFLVAADERDLLDMLSFADGMHFVVQDTVARGVQAAFITGTLSQWREAVIGGMSRNAQPNVRVGFHKIMRLLEERGLAATWRDYITKPLNDSTLLLEYRRNG